MLICCVCLGDRSDDFNEIVECDGCNITVHEGNSISHRIFCVILYCDANTLLIVFPKLVTAFKTQPAFHRQYLRAQLSLGSVKPVVPELPILFANSVLILVLLIISPKNIIHYFYVVVTIFYLIFAGGIFKETDVGKWVHLVCALYLPGIAFGEPDKLSNVTLFEISSSKWGNKECQLCQDTSFSRTGMTIECDAAMCRAYFHVTW